MAENSSLTAEQRTVVSVLLRFGKAAATDPSALDVLKTVPRVPDVLAQLAKRGIAKRYSAGWDLTPDARGLLELASESLVVAPSAPTVEAPARAVTTAMERALGHLGHVVTALGTATSSIEDTDIPSAVRDVIRAATSAANAAEALREAHDRAPAFVPSGWLLAVNRATGDLETLAYTANGISAERVVTKAERAQLADDVEALEVVARQVRLTVQGLRVSWAEPLNTDAPAGGEASAAWREVLQEVQSALAALPKPPTDKQREDSEWLGDFFRTLSNAREALQVVTTLMKRHRLAQGPHGADFVPELQLATSGMPSVPTDKEAVSVTWWENASTALSGVREALGVMERVAAKAGGAA